MGVSYSFLPTCDPTYQHIVWIQHSDATQRCDARHSECGEAWKSMYPPAFPPILQNSPFNSSDWDAFLGVVNVEVNKFIPEYKYSQNLASFVLTMEILSYILVYQGALPRDSRMFMTLPCWALLFIAIWFIYRNNQAIDRRITEICNSHNLEWSARYSNQFHVQYDTRNTGCCKVKGSNSLRWILISLNNPVPGGAQIETPSINATYGQPQQAYAITPEQTFVAHDGKSAVVVQQPVVQNSGPVVGRVV